MPLIVLDHLHVSTKYAQRLSERHIAAIHQKSFETLNCCCTYQTQDAVEALNIRCGS